VIDKIFQMDWGIHLVSSCYRGSQTNENSSRGQRVNKTRKERRIIPWCHDITDLRSL